MSHPERPGGRETRLAEHESASVSSRRLAKESRFPSSSYHLPKKWPARDSKWSRGRIVAVVVFCAGLMAFTYQIPRAAASGTGGGGGSGSTNATTGTVVYPYAIPASLYPTPANLTSSNGIVGVAAVPDPVSPSSFALVNASALSVSAHPNASVWFSVLSYSASDAALIAINGTCGPNCGDIPLNWSTPSEVASFSTPITALKIAPLGSSFVIAVSSGGSTYLYNWSSRSESWESAYGPLAGRLAAIATDSTQVVVATVSGDAVEVTSLSADGALLGQATLTPSGSGSTGIVSAGVVLVPAGAVYTESVVFGVNGTDQIDFAASADGIHYSTPRTIANFSAIPPLPSTTAPGQSPLSSDVGIPGQVAFVSVGSELTLLYTTYLAGQVSPAVISSGSGGVSWAGPYLAGAVNGSVLNPVLTVGPAGIVYGAWELPAFGSSTVEEATFGPDGIPLTSPETVTTVSAGGSPSPTPPALAVDGFERPLVAWPFEPLNASGAIAYTGGYLEANASLASLESVLNDSLGSWDFATPGPPSVLGSFLANASQEIARVNASLLADKLCSAQNLTAVALYQNLTHVPLAFSGGSGTVCAAHLSPNLEASPLMAAGGVDVTNTYLAVYLDWVLEAEGVPVSASPLVSVTDVAPYSAMALAASLPEPTWNSVTVDSATENLTVVPTPYSPTAYELSVTPSLPTWSKALTSVKCTRTGGGWGVYIASDITSVSQTWTNVTLDRGASHSFTGTSTYPSVWIDNLSADQNYTWSATFRALTSEVYKTDDTCTGQTTSQPVTPITLGPSSIPTVSVSGWFTTSLAIVPGVPFVTAAYNSNHSGAKLTVQLNSSLPATVQASLANASGTQTGSISTPVINGAYTFAQSSPVNQAYTLSVSSTSRPGIPSAPGSPSFSFGAAGATPPETASASCAFTLTSAVPAVSISNATGAPYTSINASTVNVTWNSSTDALGFFTYHEVGSPVNWTVADIPPVRAPNGDWVYSIEVHGLEPMVAYNGTFGVSWGQGCLVDEDQIVDQDFTTGHDPSFLTDATLPHVWGVSLPYNPFNGTGGGVKVGWDTPASPAHTMGALTLVNGYVTISNATSSTHIAFNASQTISVSTTNGTHGAYIVYLTNVPSVMDQFGLNHHYTLTVSANYSYFKQTKSGQIQTEETAKGSASGFVYERETTDGGVPDSEKVNGWSAIDNGASDWVRANKDRDSTNGLVSDAVELEYSLDPHTLDTSGSHMLDTWNLTFLLGSEWATNTTKLLANLSAYFEFYNDTTSYSLAPIPTANQDLSNLLCTTTGTGCVSRHWVGDSSSSAANVLWSSSLLYTFSKKKSGPGPFLNLLTAENLTIEKGGWLRATLGTYDGPGTYHGYLIMTVWGKLSWGANPWETSTSNDGLPDGDQVDPLGPVILRLVQNYWGIDNQPSQDAGVESLIDVTLAGASEPIYSEYSSEVVVPMMGGCTVDNTYQCYLTWEPDQQVNWNSLPFVASIPIVSASQTLSWSMTLVANNSSNGPLQGIDYADFSGNCGLSSFSTSCPVDLTNFDSPIEVQPSLVNRPTSYYTATPGNASLTYEILPPVQKSTTLLVTPANETTLSWNALGHAKYVGEPDFDLLVLNVTSGSPVKVSGIPNATGGANYSLTLQPGLNNILVPRGIFLFSPLGQALLNASTANVSSKSLSFGSAYWSNRTSGSGVNPDTDANFIRVFNATNYSQQDSGYYKNTTQAFGGYSPLEYEEKRNGSAELQNLSSLNVTNSSWLAGQSGSIQNLTGENGSESRQIQLVVWLNVTNSSTFSSQAGELRSLLAGLILNATGATSFQVVNVSGDLDWLELPQTVMSVIASPSVVNIGGQSAPWYCSGCSSGDRPLDGLSLSSLLGSLDPVWNDLIGFGTWFLQGLESIPAEFVSAAESAGAYIAGAVSGVLTAASDGLQVLAQQTVQALRAIEQAMLWALDQLVDKVLEPLLQPLLNAAESFDASLAAAANATINDQVSLGYVTPADGVAWAHAFDSIAYLGAAIAIGVSVAIAILTAVSLGAGFLVSLILSLIPTFAQYLVQGLATVTSLSSQAVTDLENSFPNSVSKTTWGALAGAVAIAASGADFFWALATAAMKGLTESIALTLAFSIIADLVVFVVSWVSWASQTASLAITALLVAGAATFVAFRALSLGAAIPDLQTYARVSVILAGVGVVAAGADVVLKVQ